MLDLLPLGLDLRLGPDSLEEVLGSLGDGLLVDRFEVRDALPKLVFEGVVLGIRHDGVVVVVSVTGGNEFPQKLLNAFGQFLLFTDAHVLFTALLHVLHTGDQRR